MTQAALLDFVRVYGDTDTSNMTPAQQEDVRVMRQIEQRAYALQDQMDRLQLRWIKRRDKLHERRPKNVRVGYEFRDVLA